jgi:hypothetical protein
LYLGHIAGSARRLGSRGIRRLRLGVEKGTN